MVKIFKTLGYLTFFLLALVFFVPKSSLYHYGEKYLETQKVIISDEIIIDKALSLRLEDATLYYDAIETAKVSEVDVNMFVFYNSIEIKDVLLAEISSSFLPLKIQEIRFTHTVFNPTNVKGIARGEFGVVKLTVDLLQRAVTLFLTPSKLMEQKYKRTLKMLKKNEEGIYEYAKNF